VADLGLVQARALWLFDLSMVVAGIAYVGVLNGGAAMLMTTLDGSLRARHGAVGNLCPSRLFPLDCCWPPWWRNGQAGAWPLPPMAP
jgi:hypothetical protein